MICALCPRNCNAIRTPERSGGVCGMPSCAVVAKMMIHQWEEPCLTGLSLESADSGNIASGADSSYSGNTASGSDSSYSGNIASSADSSYSGKILSGGGTFKGAGAVFFSGCNLRCVFCQNREISYGGAGKRVSTDELRQMFRSLVEQGAACLDLVTPSHFVPAVLEALGEEPWSVPVVWNCGGYEKPDTLQLLRGRVQIYLPDLKYALEAPAQRYSGAGDYFTWAAASILEMYRQTGPYRMENGLLRSGVLIRHLMLPGELENTRRVIDWVAETFQPGEVLFSLMSQYTPQKNALGNLARRVRGSEYRAAVAYMENCGIQDGYTQSLTSAVAEYTPEF